MGRSEDSVGVVAVGRRGDEFVYGRKVGGSHFDLRAIGN